MLTVDLEEFAHLLVVTQSRYIHSVCKQPATLKMSLPPPNGTPIMPKKLPRRVRVCIEQVSKHVSKPSWKRAEL